MSAGQVDVGGERPQYVTYRDNGITQGRVGEWYGLYGTKSTKRLFRAENAIEETIMCNVWNIYAVLK